MVVQTTFPVPTVIVAQCYTIIRFTKSRIHGRAPQLGSYFRCTNDSTPSNGVSTSSLRFAHGTVASHVWSHRTPYLTSRDSGAMRRIKGCLLRVSRQGTVAPCIGTRVVSSSLFNVKQVHRQGGRVKSYLGHWIFCHSEIPSPIVYSSI